MRAPTRMLLVLVGFAVVNVLPWLVYGPAAPGPRPPAVPGGVGGPSRQGPRHGDNRFTRPSGDSPTPQPPAPRPPTARPAETEASTSPLSAAPIRVPTWPAGRPMAEIDTSSTRQFTGPELLAKYVKDRPNRVCIPLPENVSTELEADHKLGIVSETRMPAWRRAEYRALYPLKADDSDPEETVEATSGGDGASVPGHAAYAYVMMVSNHKYVDGALVMGDSMREHSPLVRTGKADLVILVSEKMHPDSLRQLALVFDSVRAIRTLGDFTPKSYYKTTFDKAYLLTMVEYRRVLFLDADHLMSKGKSVDRFFSKPAITRPNEIVAVGGI